MKKIIIALTGQIASGKDVTKKYLTERYGAQSVKFSQVLRDVLNRVYVPIERKSMQDLSTILRKTFGEDILAKAIAHDAGKLESDIVVIDGVRRMADISHAEKLPGFFLVKIEATPQIRYERMKARNENVGDAEKSFEQFLEDHKSEADQEVPLVMSRATHSLNNDGEPEELFRQIDALIKEISKA